jgi:leader peptidase (prepilin peptidase)/N-methyltransferase
VTNIILFFNHNPIFWLGTVGVLGLCIGSFLNVVIYRLPIILHKAWHEEYAELLEKDSSVLFKESKEPFNLWFPRSQCPSCHHPLSLLDNIPIISYYLLKGRCRYCNTPITQRYPLVELLTAFLSILVAWKFGVTEHTLLGLIFTWILIALSAIDYDEMLLPDQLTMPLIWLGLLSSIIPGAWVSPIAAILGAVLGYMVLWSLYWIFKAITHKEGMGYGDFKLCAALGAWLGCQSLPMLLLVASTLGTIIGLTQILLKKHQKGDPMPFGPFLAISGWIHFIWF